MTCASVIAEISEHVAEIVDVSGDLGMLGPERRLDDGYRPLVGFARAGVIANHAEVKS